MTRENLEEHVTAILRDLAEMLAVTIHDPIPVDRVADVVFIITVPLQTVLF